MNSTYNLMIVFFIHFPNWLADLRSLSRKKWLTMKDFSGNAEIPSDFQTTEQVRLFQLCKKGRR